MFRNPTTHAAKIYWAMTKEDAEDLLSLVSHIHRRLDAAHLASRVPGAGRRLVTQTHHVN
jgi:hypothetical protein